MKTYILKLKTTSTTNYNLYDGTTLVSDSDLATLFGSAGSAYFAFDFNEGTPTNTTSLTILNSEDTAVMTNTGLEGIAEDRNFKGVWADSATAFTSFTLLKGVAMDEAELTTLVGMVKNAGPTVVQTIGTSQTDVMSQDAVTSMAFSYGGANQTQGIRLTTSEDANHASKNNDPSGCFVGGITNADSVSVSNRNTYATIIGNGQVGNGCIAIGAGTKYQSGGGGPSSTYVVNSIFIGASSGGTGESSSSKASYVIGIGKNARANRSGAVALGAYSSASTKGEMNIGSTNTNYGYNSSNYRLLTGLYDPQNAHDAATKGYVDGLVGNIESALNIINNGGGN